MKFYTNGNGDNANEEDNSYWVSISDLMAGLLIIFILTLTYYMLTYSQKTARITDNDRIRREILVTIKDRLEEKSILGVQIDKDHGVLRLPEGILFASGKAEVNEKGKEIIRILAPVLVDVLTSVKYRGRVETVFVEGHTDSIRMVPTASIKDNWELSARRAIVTWDSLRHSSPTLNLLLNDTGQPIFSCSGYADTRPIASNDESTRHQNRRIDMRFAMAPPKTDDEIPIIRTITSALR